MSQLKMTTATPTLANVLVHHSTNCPLLLYSGVDDNLWSYDVNSKFSRVSKHGGALGIYLVKVRALNSDIGLKTPLVGVILTKQPMILGSCGRPLKRSGATVTLGYLVWKTYEFVELYK